MNEVEDRRDYESDNDHGPRARDHLSTELILLSIIKFGPLGFKALTDVKITDLYSGGFEQFLFFLLF